MNAKRILAFFTLLLCLGFIGDAWSAEDGNKRKGKYTYRKVYSDCNARGGAASPKPVLDPDAHTQAEWDKIFAEKKFDAFGCKEEWSKLSEEDLKNIHSYLLDFAADSPTPAKCK